MRQEWSVSPSEFDNVASVDPEQSETAEFVVDAVEALPAHLRAIANAVWWERLSHPEAIKRLGLAQATYWRDLAETKARLQASLSRLYPVGEVPATEP